MKSYLKNFFTLFLLPLLILRRYYYWSFSDKSKLPGKEFAVFGFKLGSKLFFKGKISPRLLLNPVSIVRYFEFDYTNTNSQLIDRIKVLDISSPYLFGFFQSIKNNLDYHYINPDQRDLANVISLSEGTKFKADYSTQKMDALNLFYSNAYFDRVLSISVIEHIGDNGDSEAMKEIWRVLKPGGLLILTFPVKKIYEIEYRDKDEYNLNPENKSAEYFFQRIYDKQKIEERLLSSITNYEITSKKVFGVIEKGFYSEYKKRWIKFSYWETVKDPYYISTKFSYFNNIDDLEDIGVIGITIRKLK
jgi:SAM-dependent methyltransferase